MGDAKQPRFGVGDPAFALRSLDSLQERVLHDIFTVYGRSGDAGAVPVKLRP
jgi:hypothetical protein